jgi:hypothetical protein
MFVQVDKILQIDLINIPHIVLQNQNDADQIEAKIKQEKNKEYNINLYLLVEEKILLDLYLMFVQVDDIHQIDLFHIMHIVLQNRDYIYQNEAKIKEIKIYD